VVRTFNREASFRRGAFTVIELLVAASIMGMLAVCVTPLVRWIGVERRLVEQRTVALSQVNAALEAHRARNSPPPMEPLDVPLGGKSKGLFPEGRLTLTRGVTPPAGDAKDGVGELPEGNWLIGTLNWRPFPEAKPLSVTQAVWLPGGAK
jgi:type II secretory pathway pseudopilin PulG